VFLPRLVQESKEDEEEEAAESARDPENRLRLVCFRVVCASEAVRVSDLRGRRRRRRRRARSSVEGDTASVLC
jgi:hypothetical protein